MTPDLGEPGGGASPAAVASSDGEEVCTRGECAWLPESCRQTGPRADGGIERMIRGAFPDGDVATSHHEELRCHMAVYHRTHCASSGPGASGAGPCSAADFVHGIAGVDTLADSGEIARAMARAADAACARASAAEARGLNGKARAIRRDARRYAALAAAELSTGELQARGL